MKHVTVDETVLPYNELFGVDNTLIHLYNKVKFREDRDFKLAVLYCGQVNFFNNQNITIDLLTPRAKEIYEDSKKDKPTTQLGWTLKAIIYLNDFIGQRAMDRVIDWNILPEFKRWLFGRKLIPCTRDVSSDEDSFGYSRTMSVNGYVLEEHMCPYYKREYYGRFGTCC
jgi:hypothetical protein